MSNVYYVHVNYIINNGFDFNNCTVQAIKRVIGKIFPFPILIPDVRNNLFQDIPLKCLCLSSSLNLRDQVSPL